MDEARSLAIGRNRLSEERYRNNPLSEESEESVIGRIRYRKNPLSEEIYRKNVIGRIIIETEGWPRLDIKHSNKFDIIKLKLTLKYVGRT